VKHSYCRNRVCRKSKKAVWRSSLSARQKARFFNILFCVHGILSHPFHFSNSECICAVSVTLSQPAFLHGSFSLRILSSVTGLLSHYHFLIQIFSSVSTVLQKSDLKIVIMVNWVIRVCIHAHLWLYYSSLFSFSLPYYYPVDNLGEIHFWEII